MQQKKKAPPKQQQQQQTKMKSTKQPTKPIKLLHQINAIKQKISFNYSKNSYLINMVQLSQLNTLLSTISLQFIPYMMSKADLKLFINIFTKLNEHKEIAICIIMKILEAYFYQDCANKEKVQDIQLDVLAQIKNFYDLIDFCLTLNAKQSSPVLFEALLCALNKLQSWCVILSKYKKIGQDIRNYLLQNFKDEVQAVNF